jgi:ribosomal protein L12E/L44/L45/RPP1/RPP2
MASNSAVVGALSVILGGDATAFDKMLKGAESSVAGFVKRIGTIAGGIGLEKALTGAVNAIVGTIKQGLESADKLAKMSEATGIGVDQLSRYAYAGDLAGVSSDNLGKSLQKLSESMVAVANGSATPAAEAFKAIGVAVQNADGTLRPMSDVLGDVAAKFAGYKDGAAKAALAQAIFGDGGAAMIPLLNKGRDGLAEAGAEAEKFGLVLSDSEKNNVLSFNESLKKMDAIKSGLAQTIAAKLSPAFSTIAAAMLTVKGNSSLLNVAIDIVSGSLKYVATVGLTVITTFERITATFGAFAQVAKLIISGNFVEAWNVVKGSVNDTAAAYTKLGKTAKDMWNGASIGAVKAADDTEKAAAPILKAAEAMRSPLQLFLDTSAKRTAAVEAEALTVGKSTAEQAKLRLELEAQAIATTKGIAVTPQLAAAIALAGNAAALAAQKLAGAQLTQASLAPWQERNVLLKQYNDLLNAGVISTETFNAATMKVQFPSFSAAARQATDFQMSVDALSTSMVNGLASALAQVYTGTKSAGEAFAAFSLQIITQLVEMIIKALLFKAIMLAIGFAGGGPVMGGTGFSLSGTGGLYDDGGYTGAGGKYQPAGIVHKGEVVFSQADVAAWGGVGNVEALRLNRQMPSYAGGGPVGRVSPGVSVPQVAQGSRTIEVRGLNAHELYTRDNVAVLLKKIGAMLGNGYKLAPV